MPNELALVESRNMPRLASALYDSIHAGLVASVTEENLTALAIKRTTEALATRVAEAAATVTGRSFYDSENDKTMQHLGLLSAAMDEMQKFIEYRQNILEEAADREAQAAAALEGPDWSFEEQEAPVDARA